MAVPALRPAPSQQATMAVPVVPRGDDVQFAGTMVATTKTMVAIQPVDASAASSCSLPIDAEFVDDEPAAPRRPRTPTRRITVGEGVLQRVPPQRAWLVPTLVAVTTVLVVLGVAT